MTFHTIVINPEKHDAELTSSSLKHSHISPLNRDQPLNRATSCLQVSPDLLHEGPAHWQGSFLITSMKSHLPRLFSSLPFGRISALNMIISPQRNAQTLPGVPNRGTPAFIRHVPASEPGEQAAPAKASLLMPEKEKVGSVRLQGQTKGKTT